ncbi:MAG: GNAT family N-acetyltransferase [Chloroflexota bacterium]|nr:GNAT family N-acetyltransferase [Chloroflexota bacterium]
MISGCGDPEVARWMPRMPHPYSNTDAASFMTRAETGWAEGSLAAFAVVANGAVVGSVSFSVADPKVPEVHGAYWALAQHRGQGFITSAVLIVVDWALSELQVARYELRTDPANTASCVVARKAGFEEEGLIRCAYRRRDGELSDLLSWSRTIK